jgi:hypothetical protein
MISSHKVAALAVAVTVGAGWLAAVVVALEPPALSGGASGLAAGDCRHDDNEGKEALTGNHERPPIRGPSTRIDGRCRARERNPWNY